MIKIYIWTIKQNINSNSKLYIWILWKTWEIIKYIWTKKENKTFKWLEFEGELEEWIKLKICYNSSINWDFNDYLSFKVWDKLTTELIKNLIQYK